MTLHLQPPLTPRGVLIRHPPVVFGIVLLALTLAVLAVVDDSSVLLRVDEPVQRWVEGHRTPQLTRLFRAFSRLGSNVVVFSVFGVVVIWTLRRCTTLALTLSAAVLIRPPMEFVLKELLSRDRPDMERLVPGTGHSMPSGHVLAAVALWGLLPPLVAAFSHSRTLWWATVALAAVLILGISASRIYLGVHWMSDVIAGFALGAIYLVALEEVFAHHHRRRRCPLVDNVDTP